MEGNYAMKWTAYDAAGRIEGEFEQTIYGSNLPDAMKTFVIQHGEIGPDENGTMIVITQITWQPL